MFSELAVILVWVGIHVWGVYVRGWVCPAMNTHLLGWVWPGEGARHETWGRGEYLSPSLDMGPGILLPPPPPVLTPSLGPQKTYGWQAGGTHPTGYFLVCTTYPYTFSSVLSNVE